MTNRSNMSRLNIFVSWWRSYLGVSSNGRSPKPWVSTIIVKWSNVGWLGVSHFRKPPYRLIGSYLMQAYTALESNKRGKKWQWWGSQIPSFVIEPNNTGACWGDCPYFQLYSFTVSTLEPNISKFVDFWGCQKLLGESFPTSNQRKSRLKRRPWRGDEIWARQLCQVESQKSHGCGMLWTFIPRTSVGVNGCFPGFKA